MAGSPPSPIDEEEMTPHLRGAMALYLLQTRGPMTTTELAAELGCHRMTARRTLYRLELSRRFVLIYERPYWYLSESNGTDGVPLPCYAD